MAASSDAPLDLYIAVYGDSDAAQTDWAAIKAAATEGSIAVDGLALISRGLDGRIDVDDDMHAAGAGAVLGAAGGLFIGLIFPPAFLASGLVGAGIGAGLGGLLSHHEKKEIRDEVAEDLPPGSSAIVVLSEETFADEIARSLPNATNVSRRKVDQESAEPVKAAAAGGEPSATVD